MPLIVPKVFTKEQCETIISYHSDWPETAGGILEDGTVNPNIRECKTYVPSAMSETPDWIGAEISKTISFVNEKTYNFNLGGILELVLLRYDLGGHYETHIDIGTMESIISKRKISFSLFLNDSYEGGTLKFIGLSAPESNPETGDMVLFPSYFPHKIEPKTSGVRWALVGWCFGTKPIV